MLIFDVPQDAFLVRLRVVEETPLFEKKIGSFDVITMASWFTSFLAKGFWFVFLMEFLWSFSDGVYERSLASYIYRDDFFSLFAQEIFLQAQIFGFLV